MSASQLYIHVIADSSGETAARLTRAAQAQFPDAIFTVVRYPRVKDTNALLGVFDQITQARAVCHVGNREILTVNAALGDRPLEHRGQWEQMPDVPGPKKGVERKHTRPTDGTIHDRLQQRMVKGRPFETIDGTQGDGQVLMWARLPDVLEDVDATALAVLGDFVPMGVGQALGVRGGGNSLDNTLRVVHLVPTEWVLLDIRVHAVERGFGHGLVHMFAEDGTLLATASQSCIVRYWKG